MYDSRHFFYFVAGPFWHPETKRYLVSVQPIGLTEPAHSSQPIPDNVKNAPTLPAFKPGTIRLPPTGGTSVPAGLA